MEKYDRMQEIESLINRFAKNPKIVTFNAMLNINGSRNWFSTNGDSKVQKFSQFLNRMKIETKYFRDTNSFLLEVDNNSYSCLCYLLKFHKEELWEYLGFYTEVRVFLISMALTF